MTNPLSSAALEQGSLPCHQIVYRKLGENHFDPQKKRIHSNAFYLRPVDLETGLSVHRIEVGPPDLYCRGDPTCAAVATLHVGRVRNLGLDVLSDIAENDPFHAVIVGMPNPRGTREERKKAERLMGQLRDISRFAWPQALL